MHPPWLTYSTTCSVTDTGEARGPTPRASGSSLRPRDHPRGSVFRQDCAIEGADLGHLRSPAWSGLALPKAKTRLTCAGQGRVRPSRASSQSSGTCPDLSWPWREDRRSLPVLFGSRPGDRATQPVGQHSGWRVEDGTRASVLPARGGGLRGGPPATSIFSCRSPHAMFHRDGADLYCRVPISMVQACSGGDFSLGTLDGEETRVKVPEGTQTAGSSKSPRQHARAACSRDFGDLYVQAVVETPQNSGTSASASFCRSSIRNRPTRRIPNRPGFAKMKDFLDNIGDSEQFGPICRFLTAAAGCAIFWTGAFSPAGERTGLESEIVTYAQRPCRASPDEVRGSSPTRRASSVRGSIRR